MEGNRRNGTQNKESTRGQVGELLGQEAIYSEALGLVVMARARTLPLQGSREMKGKRELHQQAIWS